ncbi:MRE11 [Symbiodinium necroappetens]|uniref:MRE11 protein n=1 Tax=Symbiodinium necroappetens TaxID=1628268 RepID=A0A813BN13_9DINO|nr:MRE11 [Symbiodinium necroappetens]
MADELPDADTLRILILTDTHVGFNEKDKVRGKDSLETLEEALQIGKNGRADLILHGGDLFHENKPSRGCLFRTMNLLKQYTMGSGEVAFEVVSDPACFGTGQVNYKDPNLNVECPFFMIHGNHDDPGGESNLCAANILEVGGLCNYFGRHEDLEDIIIRPILLVKGKTRVAIYGLGNIRDERLHRAFQAKKVRFETPVDTEKWFHVMILHQNRHKGNKGAVPSKACIHEEMLPSFLDLVIWGHEHDCQVKPQESLRGEFYVMQPGSSVATSLSPQEAGLKHVALIDVKEGVFRCNPVPLWTVRPLVMRDIVLSETGLLKTDTQAIWNALSGEVDSMIAQGEEEIQRRKKELEARGKFGPKKLEVPELPLVRLRVEHSGFDTISGATFGNQFVGRVANPDEVLLFHRRAGGGATGSRKVQGLGDILEIEENTMPGDDGVKIQDIIYKYIEGEQNLQVLPEPDLNDAVPHPVHSADSQVKMHRVLRRPSPEACSAVLRHVSEMCLC